MKKVIFILFFVVNSINIQCQGIGSMTVLNGSFITTIDTVFLKVTGGFSELGGVMSKGYSVTGSVITASINGCTSGIQTSTNVDETIKINPLSQGMYKIKVKLIEYDNFIYPGCNVQKSYNSDSLNITVVTYTGIKENTNNFNVSLYPNPIKDKLTVNFFNQSSETKITLINSIGQTIYYISEIPKTNQLDFAFIPAGLYFLKIENNNEQKIFKILKE